MNIDYLVNHQSFISVLAKWNQDEWGMFTDKTLKEIETRYQETAQKKIPMTLVALEGSEILGAVSLIEHDLKSEPDLTPWMAALYVEKQKRGKGIGTALVLKALQEAKALQVKTLYLYADENKGSFYQRLGWETLKSKMEHEKKVLVMKIHLEKAFPDIVTIF